MHHTSGAAGAYIPYLSRTGCRGPIQLNVPRIPSFPNAPSLTGFVFFSTDDADDNVSSQSCRTAMPFATRAHHTLLVPTSQHHLSLPTHIACSFSPPNALTPVNNPQRTRTCVPAGPL